MDVRGPWMPRMIYNRFGRIWPQGRPPWAADGRAWDMEIPAMMAAWTLSSVPVRRSGEDCNACTSSRNRSPTRH
jgi:hypothetical protein